MMLSSTNVLGAHLANVVSAVISNDGQFMSGSWLQHDMVIYSNDYVYLIIRFAAPTFTA